MLAVVFERAAVLTIKLGEIVERTVRGDHLDGRTEPGDDCGGRHKTSDASQEVPRDRRQMVQNLCSEF